MGTAISSKKALAGLIDELVSMQVHVSQIKDCGHKKEQDPWA